MRSTELQCSLLLTPAFTSLQRNTSLFSVAMVKIKGQITAQTHTFWSTVLALPPSDDT